MQQSLKNLMGTIKTSVLSIIVLQSIFTETIEVVCSLKEGQILE